MCRCRCSRHCPGASGCRREGFRTTEQHRQVFVRWKCGISRKINFQQKLAILAPRNRKRQSALDVQDAVIDGETVALDEKGRSSSQLLQEVAQEEVPIAYYAFDLLRLNGKNLQALPIEERKAQLEELLKKQPGMIRYSVSFTKHLGHHSRPAWVCGKTTSFASEESDGTSQRKRIVAAEAHRNCAATKPGVSPGRIPANVSVNARASVTAGLAKEVEAVNQYAPAM